MALQAGDIVFIDSGSFLNRGVQIVSRFKYGHVGIMITPELIVDIAAFHSYRVIHIDELKISKYAVGRVKQPHDLSVLGYISMEMEEKKPKYDYWAIVRLFMRYTFGFNTSRKSYDIRRLYCSEYVDYVYNQMGVDLLPGEPHLISVEDLFFSDKIDIIDYGESLSELKELT